MKDLAKKVRTQRVTCLNCGEDFISDIEYCIQCGKSSDVGIANPIIGTSGEPYEDDDVPIRASNLMWMDGLLFTELWYIPVLLILNGVFAALLLVSPSIHIDKVLILIAAAITTAIVLLIAWKRR